MALPRLHIVGALALFLLATGCGEVSTSPGAPSSPTTASSEESADPPPPQGDVATWQLQQPEFVNPLAQWLMVEVTRLDCASGETGEVLEPQVSYDNDRIVIRTDVAPITGAQDCQGNDAVPVEIHLDQSIGERDLVDAACLDGKAVATTFCEDGAVRWVSPSRGATAEIPDWTAPADYSFVVQAGCGERAFIGRYAVTVAAGSVIAVEPLGDSYDGITPAMTPTLNDMLDEARAAEGQGTVEVAVDEAGVPRWIYADPIPNAIDDETCYAISEFRQP